MPSVLTSVEPTNDAIGGVELALQFEIDLDADIGLAAVQKVFDEQLRILLIGQRRKLQQYQTYPITIKISCAKVDCHNYCFMCKASVEGALVKVEEASKELDTQSKVDAFGETFELKLNYHLNGIVNVLKFILGTRAIDTPSPLESPSAAPNESPLAIPSINPSSQPSELPTKNASVPPSVSPSELSSASPTYDALGGVKLDAGLSIAFGTGS